GGFENTILTYGQDSTIAGGHLNSVLANAHYATISGGDSNTNGGYYATIPGGEANSAVGSWSFAAGRHARANHAGTFVWADSNNPNFASSSANQFAARCTGGAAFVTGLDASGNTTTGAVLPAGSGSWSSVSDRSAK